LGTRKLKTSHKFQPRGIFLAAAVLALAVLFQGPCRAQTAETYRKQAFEFSKAKSWDQAIANYREALALEPNDALTHYDLALALKYSGRAAQAVPEHARPVAAIEQIGCGCRPDRAVDVFDGGADGQADCRAHGAGICVII